MTISSEKLSETDQRISHPPLTIARTLWPRLVELWIAVVLIGFFFIRVLGSHAAQRVFSLLGHRHLP